ncbi:MAG: hypothetical protein J7J98_07635 [candidate division Zixibacteria bacterium]|nr:hypothetical protein [candidate division Zixibacteria bacterium]
MIEKATVKQMNQAIEQSKFLLEGLWHVVHKNRFGKVLSEEWFKNLITNEGLDYALNALAHGGTAISAWYFAPFSNDYTPLATNTYASPGYTEMTTLYNEATRQEWAEGASSGQSITNAVAATITATGAVTVYGAGIVGGGTDANTKGDTAGGGTLLASGKFATGKTLAESETLDLTYTLNGASS